MSKRIVVILGAGFSRSVSHRMPLTDDLGNLALEAAGLETRDWWMSGWNFEALLSRWAEDQPDLNEEENLLNRSRFASLSRAIGGVLQEREAAAFADGAPSWLFDLAGLLHASRASVITFNYDTLLEATVMGHQIFDWDARHRVLDSDVIGHLPPSPPGTWGDEQRSTFELLKLHGSLNWWWSPGDLTAGSVNRWRLNGTFGSPWRPDEDGRARLLPGRSRFIVPPTATKSSYYNNPFTRELWHRAHRALASADSIYLVGYSLSATDLVTAGMIRDAVGPDATLTVVNPYCAEIEGRLLLFGYEPDRIRRIQGEECVSQFVDALQATSDEGLLTSLATGEEPAAPLCVAWSEGLATVVRDVQRAGDTIVLATEPLTSGGNAFRERHEKEAASNLGAVLTVLPGSTGIVAQLPGAEPLRIAQLREIRPVVGSQQPWCAFVPSGAPPNRTDFVER